MGERALKVAVAAQTIPYLGGGLGHFLIQAMRSLSASRPGWRFDVVASLSFPELAALGLPNVHVTFWDDTPQREAATQAARLAVRVLRRSAEPRGVVQRYAERFGVPPTRLNEIWARLASADAVWIPQYNIQNDLLRPLKDGPAREVPSVLTIHDVQPVFFPDDWHAPMLSRFWGPFATYAAECTRVVTHARFQRDAIVRHLQVDRERVGVVAIPPLIDAARLLGAQPASPEVLASFGITDPFLLYPGSTTHAHKNHTRLILAWSQLQARLGDRCPQLVCTAKGHRWPELSSLIAGLGLSGRVAFTDTVPTGTLASLLKASTMVIVPTLYEGGGSGPVADACLVGRPVLSSRIGPIEEQLDAYGGDFATFFDPESVLDIADTVQRAMGALPALERRAAANRERLAERVAPLWAEWAEYYCGQFAEAAATRALVAAGTR